jgi:HD-GYP domain-containing protein (c-di-GMP phosphodiesterase class II)
MGINNTIDDPRNGEQENNPRLQNIAEIIRTSLGHQSTIFFAIVDKQTGISKVVALSKNHPAEPPIDSYNIVNTPCLRTINRGFCSFYEPAEKFPLDTSLRELGIRHYLGTEIPLDDRHFGLLVALAREPVEAAVINNYFEMTGLENGKFTEYLYMEMKRLNRDERTLMMPELQRSVGNSLLKVLVNRNKETARHCLVVSKLAVELAARLGIIDADQLDKLKYMAALHDIGKLKIPQSIINKPGPLTPDEWETMMLHPIYSMKILNKTVSLRGLDDGILFHHERWDGKGYPFGLHGENIPLPARIIAAVDKLAAIMEPRPYNLQIPTIPEMKMILHSMSGNELDPAIVATLVVMIDDPTIQELLLNQEGHTDRLLEPIFE